MIREAKAATWIGFLVATLAALRFAATGDLTPPPFGSLAGLEAWVDARTPITTAIALVRFGAEVATWYLLVLSLLHGASKVLHLPGAAVLADALAGPAVRRFVHGALGVGLVVSSTGRVDAVIDTTGAPAAERIPERSAGLAVQQPLDVGTATMRPVVERHPGTARMTPVAETVERPTSWRVDPGDSFWSIATEILETAWQRSPTDREVDPFWRALVDVNRDRLAAVDDPDLVIPGQVFDIPPVPGPTG